MIKEVEWRAVDLQEGTTSVPFPRTSLFVCPILTLDSIYLFILDELTALKVSITYKVLLVIATQ